MNHSAKTIASIMPRASRHSLHSAQVSLGWHDAQEQAPPVSSCVVAPYPATRCDGCARRFFFLWYGERRGGAGVGVSTAGCERQQRWLASQLTWRRGGRASPHRDGEVVDVAVPVVMALASVLVAAVVVAVAMVVVMVVVVMSMSFVVSRHPLTKPQLTTPPTPP